MPICEKCGTTWLDVDDSAKQGQCPTCEVERLQEARFLPAGDNYHNAAVCPPCGEPLRKALAGVKRLQALVDTFRQIVRTEQARHVNARDSNEFDWRFEQGGESACHSILTKMEAAEAAGGKP